MFLVILFLVHEINLLGQRERKESCAPDSEALYTAFLEPFLLVFFFF